MENRELIERYIYAVTKHMPSDMKKDVADELTSIIQDMLEEKCGEVIPTEQDIKVVLTQLGTPAQLSAKYDNDADNCLIGAPYFITYKYVLKLVFLCVVFGMAIAQIIDVVTNNRSLFYFFTNIFSSIFGGLLFAFAFVTLLFAFFYHKGIEMNTLYDSIDNLPPVPKQSRIIPKREAVGGIIMSSVFVIIFLVCPQIFCAVITETGTTIPLFNVEYLRNTWYIIILFALAGIGRDSVKLMEGRYSRRLMITTIIADILSGGLSIVWLGNPAIANPEFTSYIVGLFKDDTFIGNLFGNFHLFFLGIVLFALVLDMTVTIFKTLRE